MVLTVFAERDWPDAADRWRPGDDFPLIECAPLDRYRRRLAERGVTALPAVPPRNWPGVVLSCGDATYRSAAALLARATGRPHQHVPLTALAPALAAHAGAPVALVAALDDLDAAGDWLPAADAPVGVVTARGTPALVTLVYRTLTAVVTGEPEVRRLTHPTMPGAAEADVIEFADMPDVTDGRADLLLLRTHGRECCLQLPDAVICGRSTPPGTAAEPAPEGMRVPSCMKGAGCFRTDVPESQRVPAHELTGDVVLAHACNPIAVGVNAMPHEVNVALGMLDGTAVAVLGAIGRHVADPVASDLLAARMAEGRRLGDILVELNRLGDGRMGERSRFGMLGDPAYTSAAEPAEPAAEPHGAWAGGDRADATADSLRRLASEVIPALHRLTWLEVPLTVADFAGLSDAVRAAYTLHLNRSGRAAAAARDAEAQALEVQRDMMTRYAEVIHRTWWQFTSPALEAMREIGWQELNCPYCGRTSARTARQRDTLASWVEVTADFCRRCGMTRWQSGEPVVDYRTDTDLWLRPDEMLPVPLRLDNHSDRTVTATLCFAFVNGRFHRLPAPVTWTVELGPGESKVVYAPCELLRPYPTPDLYEAVFASCVDGALTVLPTWLSIGDPPAGTSRPTVRIASLHQEVSR
jgi:hypothetical protein